ncbi:MAG: hypothetical protein HOP34_01290 [Methylococcaceae bacterium]|nr:hypothetical protein [Methylococcaceae bacterium]
MKLYIGGPDIATTQIPLVKVRVKNTLSGLFAVRYAIWKLLNTDRTVLVQACL